MPDDPNDIRISIPMNGWLIILMLTILAIVLAFMLSLYIGRARYGGHSKYAWEHRIPESTVD